MRCLAGCGELESAEIRTFTGNGLGGSWGFPQAQGHPRDTPQGRYNRFPNFWSHEPPYGIRDPVVSRVSHIP